MEFEDNFYPILGTRSSTRPVDSKDDLEKPYDSSSLDPRDPVALVEDEGSNTQATVANSSVEDDLWQPQILVSPSAQDAQEETKRGKLEAQAGNHGPLRSTSSSTSSASISDTGGRTNMTLHHEDSPLSPGDHQTAGLHPADSNEDDEHFSVEYRAEDNGAKLDPDIPKAVSQTYYRRIPHPTRPYLENAEQPSVLHEASSDNLTWLNKVSESLGVPPSPENTALTTKYRQNPPESVVVYEVGCTQPTWSSLVSRLQCGVERIAGARLSWGPLREPERTPADGFTRVYSSSFIQHGRFYEDIPTPLAEELFPKLVGAQAIATRPLTWLAPAAGKNAVYMKNGTPLQSLQRRGASRQPVRRVNVQPQPASGASAGPSGQDATSTPHTAVGRPGYGKRQINPILFVSVETGRNESIAIAVNLGEDDGATMRNIRAALSKLPSSRWKRSIGVQFYRVCFPFARNLFQYFSDS